MGGSVVEPLLMLDELASRDAELFICAGLRDHDNGVKEESKQIGVVFQPPRLSPRRLVHLNRYNTIYSHMLNTCLLSIHQSKRTCCCSRGLSNVSLIVRQSPAARDTTNSPLLRPNGRVF